MRCMGRRVITEAHPSGGKREIKATRTKKKKKNLFKDQGAARSVRTGPRNCQLPTTAAGKPFLKIDATNNVVTAALRREQLAALLQGRRGPAGRRPPAAAAAGARSALHLLRPRSAPPAPPRAAPRPHRSGQGEPAAAARQLRTASARARENASLQHTPPAPHYASALNTFRTFSRQRA